MLPSSFKATIWRNTEAGEVVFGVEEITPITPLAPNHVAVRVTASNLSISDQLFVRPENQGGPGPMPQVLGHGGVGIVTSVGEAVDRVAPGDRVIMYGTPQCHVCWYCSHGRPEWCVELQFVGGPVAHTSDGLAVHASSAVGSLAEYAIVPQTQVVAVETELPDDQLAFLSISGSSGIGPVLIGDRVSVGDSVALVGLGPCGLSALEAAKLAGAAIIVGIDPVAERRAMALAAGADYVIDPAAEDPVAAVRRLCPDRGGFFGTGADFVFEASATTAGMVQAWEMAPAGGTVVLSSVPLNMGEPVTFPATPLACQSKTVHGSQQGGFGIVRDTGWAIAAMEAGHLDFAPILNAEYTLDQVVAAFADLDSHAVVGATLFPAGLPA